jgi:hypothetical protein
MSAASNRSGINHQKSIEYQVASIKTKIKEIKHPNFHIITSSNYQIIPFSNYQISTSSPSCRIFLFSLFQLLTDLTREDMAEHDKVGTERPKRILKGGRGILLKEKMAEPGKTIPHNRNEREKPPKPGKWSRHSQTDYAERAYKM